MFNLFRRNKKPTEAPAPQEPEALIEEPKSVVDETQPTAQPETQKNQTEADNALPTTEPETQKNQAETDNTLPAAEPETQKNQAETDNALSTAEPETQKKQAEVAEAIVTMTPQIIANVESNPKQKPPKASLFTRLKNSLWKTRQGFTDSIAALLLGRKEIDRDLLEELEMILLSADVGLDATDKIISHLTDQMTRKALKDPEALIQSLKNQLKILLEPVQSPLDLNIAHEGPFVILMVGVNGVGKTTTIGKLAKKFQKEGKSVMLAAGDTFRAAAVEQLQTWGERNKVTVIAQKTGADSAAVIFDAIQSAKAKKIDILIADTAGRLHTQSNLMEELRKVKRVIQKVDNNAPHEIMLVLDAGTGQNAINQAKQFHEAMGLTGLTLTKLDGTAKGGVIFALAEQLAIPVRFIGVGEAIDDLRPFNANEFAEALFDQTP